MEYTQNQTVTENPKRSKHRASHLPSGRGVYIIWSRNTGLYKIGKTTDLRRRMCSFYSLIPEDVHLYAFLNTSALTQVEGGLHSTFRDLREKGEWFRIGMPEQLFLVVQMGFETFDIPLARFAAN